MLNHKFKNVKYVIGESYGQMVYLSVKDGNETKTISNGAKFVTKDYLEYFGFESAITGRKESELKVGSVIIDKNLSEKIFGRKVSPIGSVVTYEGRQFRIEDVYKNDINPDKQGLFIVSDASLHLEGDGTTYSIRFVGEDGSNYGREGDKALLAASKSFHRQFPEYELSADVSDEPEALKYILPLFLFLGASVLIIGVSGFLKMQVQLFMLRGREIALRCCNGAHASQLFMLLCSEVAIVFTIVMGIALVLSVLVGEYVCDIINNVFQKPFDIDYTFLFKSGIAICALAFAVTVLIAWFYVRRTLYSPLGTVVGRSSLPKGKKHSSMLVFQVFVCSILLYFVVLAWFSLGARYDSYYIGGDIDNYKTVYWLPVNVDNMELKTIETKSKYMMGELMLYEPMEMFGGIKADDSTYHYQYIMTDENLFDLLKYDIRPTASEEERENNNVIPVFVKPSKVKLMLDKYNIKMEEAKLQNVCLPGGEMYKVVGYASTLAYNYISTWHGEYFYVVNDFEPLRMQMPDSTQMSSTFNSTTIFRPKDGDISATEEELQNRVELSYGGIPATIKCLSLYHYWLRDFSMFDIIRNCCAILMFVSLICIVLNMYSSVSLDTRGRRKEVAIRKMHGAKAYNIMRMFAMYYVKILSIAFVLAFFIGLFVVYIMCLSTGEYDVFFNVSVYVPAFISAAIITLVTILTIWYKIFKASRINAAEVMKSE